MPHIHRTSCVPYSCQQMFDLVNDIERYQEFVPWCVDSQIRSQQTNQIEASLSFAKGAIHKSFTTRNTLASPHSITVQLVDGPFKKLEGAWSFCETDPGRCQVELDLEFEFIGRLVSLAFGPIFHQITNMLVDVFCERAAVLYANTGQTAL